MQKIAKNSPSGHHRTTLSGCIFANKACIDNQKHVKQQYLLHMSSEYGGLRPTNGWDRFGSLGHPSKFQRVSRLGSLVQRHRSWEANQTLHDVWPSPGLVYYIHFPGLLLPNGMLPGAKFTLRRSLAFSYIGSVTAPHSSSGRPRNFAAWCREWNYGTFADGVTDSRLGGHYVRHRLL